MGAWGHRYFDDDSALDFMADLEESDNPKMTIHNTFKAALESDYLESDEANAVIVAASYVDRQANGTKFSDDGSEEPLSVDTFPERQPTINLTDLKRPAVEALQRLLGDDSELKELWEESGEFDEWRLGIDNLIKRLDK